jgi:hypothetical protein
MSTQGYDKDMIEKPQYVITKEDGSQEESKCSGTWCHACTNDGCCEEQKIWDAIQK